MHKKWAEKYPLSLFKRAKTQSDTAKHHLSRRDYSECISCCIEAMELFLKGASLLVKGDYPTKHIDEWTNQEIADVIKKIPIELEERIDPIIANFPRLFLLASFWTKFYNIARYGQKEFKVGANQLFKKPEADLASKHTEECWMKVSQLQDYLKRKREANK